MRSAFHQRRRTLRLALPAALALWLAGCANGPQLGPHAALPDPPKDAEVNTPAQREHQRILAAYGGSYASPRLEVLIAQTVERLIAVSDRPDLRYKVTILNSPTVNAFALPNGNLYVTRGLLALANDTSELASVLSHEMAHVIARHAAIREDQARQAALVSRVVSDVLTDPQTGALALAKSKIALASFSRSQELEADAIGVEIAARAGFDPFGAQRFLSAMGRNAELKPSVISGTNGRGSDFLSSHPSTPDRVRSAQASARENRAAGSAERDRATYLAAADGMSFGEDPSEGFVRGRRFLHPRIGFTFMAPEHFILENTAQAVLGLKEGGSQALRVDVVHVPAGQTLESYLTSGWIERADPRSVESLNINGFPAATAIAVGEQWSFRLYAIRFGSDVYRFVFASKQKLADADRAFRESVQSFRRMSLSEIEQARPLRVKMVAVRSGDTVEKLAAGMATDRPLERFLVLNGLTQGQALRPGDHVKVVVE
jgi:predicted Zn-dependent protease